MTYYTPNLRGELQSMTATQVLQFAKDNCIHIPSSCKAKAKAIRCIVESLESSNNLEQIRNWEL